MSFSLLQRTLAEGRISPQEHYKNYYENTIKANIDTARPKKGGPPNYEFIPFLQERDHLGRLIKQDSLAEDIPNTRRSNPLMSPVFVHKRSHSEKMKQIRQNTKSLYNLFIDSMSPQENKKPKIKNSSSMNQEQIYKNLFIVESLADKSLIVNQEPISPHSRSPKYGSPRSIELSPQQSITIEDSAYGMSQDYSKKPTPRIQITTEFTPDNTILQPTLTNSITSPGSLKLPPIRGNIRSPTMIRSSSVEENTFKNGTIWRYHETQEAQNKQVSNYHILKNKYKPKVEHKMLLKPKKDIVPGIGTYKPNSVLLKRRVPEVKINPKQQYVDRRPPQKLSKMAQKLLQEALEKEMGYKTITNPVIRDHAMRLIKALLQEAEKEIVAARVRQKKEDRDFNLILPLYNKLNFVTVKEFEEFPEEFNQKLQELRKKLRDLKGNIHEGYNTIDMTNINN